MPGACDITGSLNRRLTKVHCQRLGLVTTYVSYFATVEIRAA
jgi:hypothetical protein